jgi:hypothetical protein
MRRSNICGWLLVLAVFVAWPAAGHAQESTLAGTVVDSTGGVLPGVPVIAIHLATGNVFESITDGAGEFRMLVRTGTYEVTAALPGFQTVTQTGVQLLLGAIFEATLTLAPATLEETVTVTGEAPLIDTTASTVGANIDPEQMAELPINGRNWMDLALLTPGARRNESGGFVQNRQGYSQTNVDGQQVTRNYHSGGDNEQAGFSRDAIQEFQVVANRFDATVGRSAGMVVNAITKSGTNTFSGSAGGYFRHDSLNANDSVLDRKLPYSNQQVSGTLGGPILLDRLHFFASYEFERQPNTKSYTNKGVYSAFNRDITANDGNKLWMLRADYQASSTTRLTFRGSGAARTFYNGGGSGNHPINHRKYMREGDQYFGTITSVLGGNSVNEIKGGVTFYLRSDRGAFSNWAGNQVMPYPSTVLDGGTAVFRFAGYTIGTTPLGLVLDTTSLRDDFTTSYEMGGRHDVKIGFDYLHFKNNFNWCLRCTGDVDLRAKGFSVTAAEVVSMFPTSDVFDASLWNGLSALNDGARFVRHSLSDTGHTYKVRRHVLAGWYQDDWQVADNFTLNLGLRYDWDSNGHNEQLEWKPFLPGNLPRDRNNFAPRLGFNYRINDETVLRGGYGLYFAFAPNDGVQQSTGYRCFIGSDVCPRFESEFMPDGRADFIPNWFGPGATANGEFGGPRPTAQVAIAKACDQNGSAPGCVYRAFGQEINYSGRQTSYAHQASIGVQRQLADLLSFEANVLMTGGRGEERSTQGNLTYNQATGANYPFQDISRRSFPEFGIINFEYLDAISNYYGADFTLTKRYADNWQLSASYTASWFKDQRPDRMLWAVQSNGFVGRTPLGFNLQKDLGGEYTYAETDQRGRATVNGIWDIGKGLQLSGIYFYGNGNRRQAVTGRDARNEGQRNSGEQRLRTDGTIINRNDFMSQPIHRLDLRLQQRVSMGGSVGTDLMFEVFNVMNRKNYGSFQTNENNKNFGNPEPNSNISYQPRIMQLGLRISF